MCIRDRSNTTDDGILSLIELNNEEVKQENSNKNPVINSTQRDYMAGEVSKLSLIHICRKQSHHLKETLARHIRVIHAVSENESENDSRRRGNKGREDRVAE